jgi:hypothetical protein
MQHFVVNRKDGSVAIIIALDGVTAEEEIAKWPSAEQAKVASHAPIDPATIPQDRYFRDAWSHVAGKAGAQIAVDMTKAREIHRNALRRARAPLFAEADVDYAKADEAGDTATKEAVRDYKQALRDAPQDPRIDAAMTPEELKAIVPDVLL